MDAPPPAPAPAPKGTQSDDVEPGVSAGSARASGESEASAWSPPDSAQRAGETPHAGSAEGSESAPPAGPPEDATTTHEDLPGDLFGEPDPPPTRATGAGPATVGPPGHDPAIDMVQTFFPGRIVALEPCADDPDGAASEDEAVDGGPGDGAPRPSG